MSQSKKNTNFMVPVSRSSLQGGTGWVGTSTPVDGFGLVTPLGSNYLPSESAMSIDAAAGDYVDIGGDYYGDSFNIEMPGFDMPSVTFQPGIPGEPGLPGLPGTAGNHGLPGVPGLPGMAGERGTQGETGIGAEGAQGPPGPMGPMGPMGLTGSPGTTGADGQDGEPGEQGPRGYTGPAGPTGADGTALLAITTSAASGLWVTANIYNSGGGVKVYGAQVYLYVSGGNNAEYATPLISSAEYIAVAQRPDGVWYYVARLSQGTSRKAYCKVAAGAGTTIVCYLDTDATGTEITVNCSVVGGSALNAAVPRLADGSLLFVENLGGTWYCTSTVFQTTEDCVCSE